MTDCKRKRPGSGASIPIAGLVQSWARSCVAGLSSCPPYEWNTKHARCLGSSWLLQACSEPGHLESGGLFCLWRRLTPIEGPLSSAPRLLPRYPAYLRILITPVSGHGLRETLRVQHEDEAAGTAELPHLDASLTGCDQPDSLTAGWAPLFAMALKSLEVLSKSWYQHQTQRTANRSAGL